MDDAKIAEEISKSIAMIVHSRLQHVESMDNIADDGKRSTKIALFSLATAITSFIGHIASHMPNCTVEDAIDFLDIAFKEMYGDMLSTLPEIVTSGRERVMKRYKITAN